MKKKRNKTSKQRTQEQGPGEEAAPAQRPLRSARALGAPVGAAAAVATRKIDVAAGSNFLQHQPTNPLTHDVANALTHHATDHGAEVVAAAGAAGAAGAAVFAGTSATAGGTAAAGVGAASATAAGAAGAAGSGAGAAGAGAAAAAQGQVVQAAAIGTVTVAAIATVVVVVANDDEPAPEPAPTTTTTVVAAPVVQQPTPGPGTFETVSATTLTGDLMAGVDQDTEAGPLMIAGLEGQPTNVGVPITLESGATLTVDPLGTFEYIPGDAVASLPAGESLVDEFTYVVTNATGFTAEWTASVTVIAENNAPTVEEVPAVTVTEGATSSATIVAADPDDDAITISLDEGAPGFATLVDAGDGTAELTIAPGEGTAGTHDIAITVSDSASSPLTASTTVSVTVQAPAPAPARVTESLVARYDFNETDGALVGESAGVGAPALTVASPEAVTWDGGSVTINAPTVIRSDGSASALSDAIKASNEFTVEAWVTPANNTQSGPARIVSISSGIGERNVTLSQGEPGDSGGDRWTSRHRSTEGTVNGLPALATPAGTVMAGTRTHLAVTRSSSGEVQYFVNGQLVATGAAGGDLSNWDSSFALVLGNETSLDRPWLGTLHLVAVYSRALGPAEVDQNYQVGR